MNFLSRAFILSLFGISCLGLTGCTFPPRIYRIDIRQGNYVTPEMMSQLKLGMSKQAVLNIFGTPALETFIDKNRWDYYYSFRPGNGCPMVESNVTLFFKGDRVVRIEEKP